MLNAYINYPNNYVRIHMNPDCMEISNNPQRVIHINNSSLIPTIIDICNKEYKFSSKQSERDLWVSMFFDDPIGERKTFEYSILYALYEIYPRFINAPIFDHCASPEA
jgi:hypothetical protein